MQQAKPDLLTLHQVADELGIAYNTARRWSAGGKLPPPVKVYGPTCKRWSRAEIERFGTTETERDDDDK